MHYTIDNEVCEAVRTSKWNRNKTVSNSFETVLFQFYFNCVDSLKWNVSETSLGRVFKAYNLAFISLSFFIRVGLYFASSYFRVFFHTVMWIELGSKYVTAPAPAIRTIKNAVAV